MRAIFLFLALILVSTFMTLFMNQAKAGGPWNDQYCNIEVTKIKVVDSQGNLIEERTEEKMICDDGAKDFLHGMGIASNCEIFTWHTFLGGELVQQRNIACKKMDGTGYEIVKGYHNLN